MNYKVFQIVNGWSGHYIWLDRLMIFISQYALYLFAATLLAMWITGKTDAKRSVLVAGFTGIIALLVNVIIGHIYYEPRPFVSHSVHLLFPHKADSGFPSDHATGAFALALAICMRNRGLRAWGYSMLAFAVITGISRVYVGHHYPGDILASILVALLTSALVLQGEKYFDRLWPGKSRRNVGSN